MRSLSFVLMLLLRITSGLSQQYAPKDELLPSSVPPSFTCHFVPTNCPEDEECLRDVCSYLFELCQRRTGCSQVLYKCWHFLPNCILADRKIEGLPPEKRSIGKNSFLFMKLHPVLNRAVDPNLINVPTRYRRISVRLGSEFLGKRSPDLPRERRAPGTELLGKRWGSEMLGKRNWELLGKRGVELLGKRSSEFLGKRGTELLGKRGAEFLGKRGAEFLGKRGAEFLGKRGNEFLGKREIAAYPAFHGLKFRMCKNDEDCYVKWDPKLYVHHQKLIPITPATRFEDTTNNNNPNRLATTQMTHNSIYLLEKL
ncbi:UNVERIFIED_CONTAM: hypothetical protein PYX00_010302 [Menopon gallinae]|uniref:Uncharacterized protein n=1 Tax=Menopon gallinae TaxID=328185 RepID=A0AAW2HER7_9NEOP